ncbi:MAG TPA: ATP synthase F0 subunit B [Blastocatellia bacterium]|nr:ATP synthase F0 subunit B [Blastocatellia bacterium]
MTLAFAEGGGNIINPDGSLIVVLVLFVIFVFSLNRLLFRPVGRVLDERETLIEGAGNEARAARRMYDAKLAEYEATIRQARAEGYHLAEQQRAAALDARQRVIDEAKAQAHDQIDGAKQEIEQQVVRVRATLESESRQIAERISRTVLGRTLGGGAD